MRLKIKQLQVGQNDSNTNVLSPDGEGSVTSKPLREITGFDIAKGNSFPTGSTDGDLFYREDLDMFFFLDGSRSKWLSVDRQNLICGRETAKKNISAYLGTTTTLHSSTTGFHMYNNGTITNVSVNNTITVNNNRDVEIRINNSTTNKVSVPINSGNNSNILNNTDLDFSWGDQIQSIVLANNNDDLENITVIIEIAWRE